MSENLFNFCFYCGKKTQIIHKDLRKSYNGKMILITNVPLYNCKSCREVFYPSFVIKVFNKIPTLELDKNEYEYNSIKDFE